MRRDPEFLLEDFEALSVDGAVDLALGDLHVVALVALRPDTLGSSAQIGRDVDRDGFSRIDAPDWRRRWRRWLLVRGLGGSFGDGVAS